MYPQKRNNQNNKKQPKSSKNNQTKKPSPLWFMLLLFLTFLWLSYLIQTPGTEIKYSEFYAMLKNDPAAILSIAKTGENLQGELSDGKRFTVIVPQEDEDLIPLIRDSIADFQVKPLTNVWLSIIGWWGPTILFIAFLWLVSRRGQEMGGKIFSFGKSKARIITDETASKVSFKDVAGVDEAKEELTEVIEFLKDPKRFQRLGGKIPKGVLLVGPPGCGKTLLAKAVSGEAKVPFYSISGSDFVEVFVGVGASRVRDLFEQGRKAAKLSGKGAIIFIDEIDAVGRLRFSGLGGGHDEREQTLNALLVEMDGFTVQEGLILIAATNRPDTLDPALLRPGRFDRQVVIERPDINGREAILKVHVTNIKLNDKADLRVIAQKTPGFSGADLANLCNEAALLAARRNKENVTMDELNESVERVMAGPQRKSRVISKREKEIIAYHESGHSLLSLLVPEVDPLHKVSIIPRGFGALGYTMNMPLEDRYIMTKTELAGRLVVLLGGRASEELHFKEITTGAENDLKVATQIARRMVCEFGMSERLGHVTLGKHHDMIFLGRDISEERNYSEATAHVIDEEVHRIVDQAYTTAKEIIDKNIDKLDLLSKTLLEKEVMEAEEVKKLLGIKKETDKKQ